MSHGTREQLIVLLLAASTQTPYPELPGSAMRVLEEGRG